MDLLGVAQTADRWQFDLATYAHLGLALYIIIWETHRSAIFPMVAMTITTILLAYTTWGLSVADKPDLFLMAYYAAHLAIGTVALWLAVTRPVKDNTPAPQPVTSEFEQQQLNAKQDAELAKTAFHEETATPEAMAAPTPLAPIGAPAPVAEVAKAAPAPAPHPAPAPVLASEEEEEEVPEELTSPAVPVSTQLALPSRPAAAPVRVTPGPTEFRNAQAEAEAADAADEFYGHPATPEPPPQPHRYPPQQQQLTAPQPYYGAAQQPVPPQYAPPSQHGGHYSQQPAPPLQQPPNVPRRPEPRGPETQRPRSPLLPPVPTPMDAAFARHVNDQFQQHPPPHQQQPAYPENPGMPPVPRRPDPRGKPAQAPQQHIAPVQQPIQPQPRPAQAGHSGMPPIPGRRAATGHAGMAPMPEAAGSNAASQVYKVTPAAPLPALPPPQKFPPPQQTGYAPGPGIGVGAASGGAGQFPTFQTPSLKRMDATRSSMPSNVSSSLRKSEPEGPAVPVNASVTTSLPNVARQPRSTQIQQQQYPTQPTQPPHQPQYPTAAVTPAHGQPEQSRAIQPAATRAAVPAASTPALNSAASAFVNALKERIAPFLEENVQPELIAPGREEELRRRVEELVDLKFAQDGVNPGPRLRAMLLKDLYRDIPLLSDEA